MQDKDIATITAFRTDPDLGFSKKVNRERNKKLESQLNSMGYRGFIKIVGYWSEDGETIIAEESYVVLNAGSSFEDFANDMILLCKDVDNNNYDQQAVMVWNHNEKLAYLFDSKGNVIDVFNNFKIDNVSQAWSQIKNHKLTFVEESVNNEFSDIFNKGGNWLTAMSIDNKRKKFRDKKK